MHEILCFYHITYIHVKLNDHNASVLSTVGLMWDTAIFFCKINFGCVVVLNVGNP